MDKINVTAVSYLNTKPLLYGLLHHPIADSINLQLNIPAVCAEKLKSGEADLGLIPVAAIHEVPNASIVSDYCIGTPGEVKTVAIFGHCPIEEMECIYLDYHSRTSVELTKILLREYWQSTAKVIPAQPGFENKINGKVGGLIIGDRAIEAIDNFPYMYDLGIAWKQHTQLPFVFAAWVSNKSLPTNFIQQFNEALSQGIKKIPQLIYLLPSPTTQFDLEEYLSSQINYHLDSPKQKALQRFLNTVHQQSPFELFYQ